MTHAVGHAAKHSFSRLRLGPEVEKDDVRLREVIEMATLNTGLEE